MDKLLAIITGPERNGTTFFSRLFYSIPNVYSGFETGFLLHNDFKKCHPFCQWVHQSHEHWGVPTHINFFDNKLTFNDKYQLLFDNKGTSEKNDNHLQKLIRKSHFIVDKTPAYFRRLSFVRKQSKGIPIFIVIKDFM